MKKREKTKKQMISLGLSVMVLTSYLPLTHAAEAQEVTSQKESKTLMSASLLDAGVEGVGTGGTGPRSLTNAMGDIFLGNDFIEIGISRAGSYGTSWDAPISGTKYFHPDADWSSRIGLRSDGDGWEKGNAPTTRDFFLPGTIDEGFMVGWAGSKEGETTLKSSVSTIGAGGVMGYAPVYSLDKSTLSHLQAENKGIIAGALEYTQNIIFGQEDKRFTTVITMKNTTGETLYNASYIRKFDPDQNPLSHETDNYFFKDGTGGIWAVASSSRIDAPSPVAPDEHKAVLQQVENPFIFYTSDHRAQVISCGVGTYTYSEIMYRGEDLYGRHEYNDVGMGLEFIFSEIKPGETVTFSYESSLDPDIESAQEAIENLAVFISKQPVSRTYAVGQVEGKLVVQGNAVVDGEVSESGSLSYQWYQNEENSLEGATLIPVATENSYDLPKDLPIGTEIYYFCRVTAEKDGVLAKVDSGIAKISVVAEDTSIHEVRFIENTINLVRNMPGKQTVKNEDQPMKPLDPASEGLEFMGWYTESTGGDLFDFTKGITSPTAVYAQWLPVDTIKPEITEVSGNPESWVKENALITFKATDNRGIEKVTLSKDGEEEVVLESETSEYSFTAEENGTYLVTVTDVKGNVGTKEILVTKIDKTKPVIESITRNPSSWTNGTVVVKVFAEDGESGLSPLAYSFDGGKTYQAESSKTLNLNEALEIRVKDAAGNESSARSIHVTNIDKKAPVILDVTGNLTDWTKEVMIEVSAEDKESGLPEEAYSFDGGKTWKNTNVITVTKNGKVEILVVDTAGNRSFLTSVDINNIDDQAPEISNITKTADLWTKDSIIVGFTAEDKESGLADTPYSFDGGKTWQKDAVKEVAQNEDLELLAKDRLGNISVIHYVSVDNIDKTKPVIKEASTDISAWTKDQVVLTIHAEDNESGLAKEAYSFDGGKTFQKENYKVFHENEAVEIVVKDVAGNTSLVKTFEIRNIDLTKPVVVGALLKPETWTNGTVTIEVTGNDTGSGLGVEAYSFDGGKTWQKENEKTFTENEKVEILVKDLAGNTSEAYLSEVKSIDKVAPTGTIILQETPWKSMLRVLTLNLLFKDNLEVKVEAEDELSGVEKVEVFRASKKLTEEELKDVSWSDYTGAISVKAADKDQFIYYAKITDEAGNSVVIHSEEAVFDTQAPVILHLKDGGEYYTSQKLMVTDDHLGEIRVNGEVVPSGTVLEGNKEAIYQIEAMDEAGNITVYEIFMKPVKALTEETENLKKDTVKKEDEKTIKEALEDLSALDLTDATAEEKKQVEDQIEVLQELLLEIEKIKAENKLPETGSRKDAPLWMGLAAIALGGFVLSEADKKRQKAERQE